MRIGFSKKDITPPAGIVLGGYAGFRPCAEAHDPLFCRAVVLEQAGVRYGLVALDLLCADKALYLRLAALLSEVGITKERLVVCAIHSHAAPQGVLPGEGELAAVNCTEYENTPAFRAYAQNVLRPAQAACREAADRLEPFLIRAAKGPTPPVGSERHTGAAPGGDLTVVQCRTASGKVLTLCNFPCHPTVLGPDNLHPSADFAAGIEGLLGGDMAVFLNGAAGDISTRFTRREPTFAECARMGQIAAEHIRACIENAPFTPPEPLRGIHATVRLKPRPIDTVETARAELEARRARWENARSAGADSKTLRLLKTYAEGAWVSLELAKTMAGIEALELPVTGFRFAGLEFATVPGELFSTLQPAGLSVIAYAGGYFRYICPESAYEENLYDAMASIAARGEGEHLIRQIEALRRQLA